MSKIARKPIKVPVGVTTAVEGNFVVVTGKLGKLSVPVLSFTNVAIGENGVSVTSTETNTQARANLGTMASLLASAIRGVSEGFVKSLEIEGIGYRATMEGNVLVLNVGFTHSVKYEPNPAVKISVVKNLITVSGIDKGLVGETAAQIRKVKKPEPYKGKGIHYVGEVIRRKAGKKVAGAGSESK